MRHIRHFLLALAAVLAVALLSAPDLAAQTVAKTQFVEAKKRYDAGEYEDALTLFQYAWEQSHSPNARLYIARCFQKLGNIKAAYDEFRGARDDAAKRAVKDDKYVATRNAAAAELALLDPQIGRLLVILDEAVPDATVTMNDEPFPAVSIGSLVTMLPGRVKLVASAEGRNDVVREVNVVAGQVTTAPLWFERGAACEPANAPSAATNEGDGGMTGMQIAGIVVLGVGLAALGVAGATGAAASSKFGSLEQTCGDERCRDDAYAEVVDSGKTYELVSFITLGAGAGVALIGAALILFGGDSGGAAEGAVVSPLPGGGLLGYRASF